MAPCVQDRGRVAPQLVPSISQHESVAKRRLDVDGPEIHQFCRFNAAAPWRADDSREGYAFRPDLCAQSDCLRAPSLAEIPLSGASSSLKPAGSPAPPGASPWRISATYPPLRRASQAADASAAAGVTANRSATIATIWNIPKRGFEVASPERGTFNLSPHLTDSRDPDAAQAGFGNSFLDRAIRSDSVHKLIDGGKR